MIQYPIIGFYTENVNGFAASNFQKLSLLCTMLIHECMHARRWTKIPLSIYIYTSRLTCTVRRVYILRGCYQTHARTHTNLLPKTATRATHTLSTKCRVCALVCRIYICAMRRRTQQYHKKNSTLSHTFKCSLELSLIQIQIPLHTYPHIYSLHLHWRVFCVVVHKRNAYILSSARQSKAIANH